MPKFTLICDHSCDLDTHVVRHDFNAENIYEVVEQFELFLKGAGYYPQGHLDFVEDDEPIVCDDGVQHNDYYYDITRNR